MCDSGAGGGGRGALRSADSSSVRRGGTSARPFRLGSLGPGNGGVLRAASARSRATRSNRSWAGSRWAGRFGVIEGRRIRDRDAAVGSFFSAFLATTFSSGSRQILVRCRVSTLHRRPIFRQSIGGSRRAESLRAAPEAKARVRTYGRPMTPTSQTKRRNEEDKSRDRTERFWR